MRAVRVTIQMVATCTSVITRTVEHGTERGIKAAETTLIQTYKGDESESVCISYGDVYVHIENGCWRRGEHVEFCMRAN